MQVTKDQSAYPAKCSLHGWKLWLVQCDGNRPACRACSLRREICIFESLRKSPEKLLTRTGNRCESNSSGSTPSTSDTTENLACHVMAQRQPFPGIYEIDTPADMSKYSRLLYQFEHFTSDTLILGKSFWFYRILPLAFHVSPDPPISTTKRWSLSSTITYYMLYLRLVHHI